MSHLPKTKRDAAEALRRTIRGIEEAAAPEQPRLPLGVPSMDRALPGGGLRLGCIHEVAGDEAATGFCAALLARALATASHGGHRPGALLWLARGDDLYAPGLVRYGIAPGQLLVVSRLHHPNDMLWAMEETLRCRAVTGVVAEIGTVGLAAGRRLMLAAEGTRTLGLVLSRGDGGRGWCGGWGRGRGGHRPGGRRRERGGAGVRGAVSRWRVTSVPRDDGDGGGAEPQWRVELLHCRGGRRAEWTVAALSRPHYPPAPLCRSASGGSHSSTPGSGRPHVFS